jgi:2-succinyl-6-hydroxy-2,4-cyclohexadiene-1-carboxylate synthase
MKPRLILLHGFTGSGRVFDHLRDGFSDVADVETPDLPFHAVADAGPPLFTGGPICPPDFSPILHGYSMGGRFAMREALANPERVAALILESTHPGIESELEREARRQRDATLAESLVQDYDRFLATWNRLPLFASPSDAPAKPRDHFEAIQRSQVPSRMARSLIEHGAGTMMPVRDRLHTLPMPVLAMSGALDRTYTELWAGIVSDAPNIRHVIIPNAGHRVHLDNPSAYLSTVLSFIQEHIPS